MVSKNNRIKRMQDAAERKPHFGIRKLTIGAASVLLGTTMWMSVATSSVHADTEKDGAQSDIESDSGNKSNASTHKIVATVDPNQVSQNANQANNAETAASTSEQNKTNQAVENKAQAETNNQKQTPAVEDANKVNKTTSSEAKNKSVNNAEQKNSAASVISAQKKVNETNAKNAAASLTTEQKVAQTAQAELTKKINEAGTKGKTTDANLAKTDLAKTGLDKKLNTKSLNTNTLNTQAQLSSFIANAKANGIDVSKYNAKKLEQLFGASFVQNNFSVSQNGTVDLNNYQPDFHNQSDQYQGHTVVMRAMDRGNHNQFIFTVDDNNNINVYMNGSFYTSIQSSQVGRGQNHFSFTAQGTTHAPDLNGNDYYIDNYSTSKGGYTFDRSTVRGPSMGSNGVSISVGLSGGSTNFSFVDKDGNPVYWNREDGYRNPAQGLPDKIAQNIWYVDEDTGEILAHKTKEADSYSNYDVTGAHPEKVTVDGKTYTFDSDQQAAANKEYEGRKGYDTNNDIVLTTKNGVKITVGMIKDTPLKGQLGNENIGDIVGTVNIGYRVPIISFDQIKDNKGTADINAFTAYNPIGPNSSNPTYNDWTVEYEPNISPENQKSGKPFGGSVQKGLTSFLGSTSYSPANANFVFFYKQAHTVTPKTITKTVTETINYKYEGDSDHPAGSTAHDQYTTSVTFTGTAYQNENGQYVTGPNSTTLVADQNNPYTWTNDNQTFNQVNSPAIDGYTISRVVDGSYNDGDNNVRSIPGINHDSSNVTVTVWYKKAGNTPVTPTSQLHTTQETKKVTRTINYYDKVTGQRIPANVIEKSGTNVTNPSITSVNFVRDAVYDQNNKLVGYGQINQRTGAFVPYDANDPMSQTAGWLTDTGMDSGRMSGVYSPDLTSQYYTAPTGGLNATADSTEDGSGVPAWQSIQATDADRVYNIYYGHRTQNVEQDKTFTRKFHYIFTDSTTEGQTSDGRTYSTAPQTVTLKGHATKDLLTGRISNVTWDNTSVTMDGVPVKNINGYQIVSVFGGPSDNKANGASSVTLTKDSKDPSDVTFVYSPHHNYQKAKVTIVDEDNNNAELTHFTNDLGNAGDQIVFTTNSSGNADGSQQALNSYLSSGYVFDKATTGTVGFYGDNIAFTTGTNTQAQSESTDNKSKNNVTIKYGNFNTDTSDVQNFTIYLRHGHNVWQEPGKTTSTVHYIVEGNDPDKPDTPAENVQTVNWTRTDKTDLVTGVTDHGTWTTETPHFKDVTTPTLEGYTPSLTIVPGQTTQWENNPYTIVTYTKSQKVSAEKATIEIIDKTDNKSLGTFNNNAGKTGEQITFQGLQPTMQAYINTGYVIDSGFDTTNGSQTNILNADKTGWTLPSFDNVEGNTQSFKIYLVHGTKENTETGTSKAYVHYIMSDGTKAPANSSTQVINWTRTNTVDAVDGHVTKHGDWTIENNSPKTFTDVKSPDVTGYTPDQANVHFNTPQEGIDQIVNVVYTPVQKQAQKATLRVVDKTNGKVLSPFYDSGDSNTPISFGGSQSFVQSMINLGYKFDSAINDGTGKSIVVTQDGKTGWQFPSFDDDASKDQNFTIYLTHNTYDQKTTATTTGYVHYVMLDGHQELAPQDSPKQTINWTKTDTVDAITHQVTKEGTWTPDKSGFTSVQTPTVTGYTPDKLVANFAVPDPHTNQRIDVFYAPKALQPATLTIYDETNNNSQLAGYATSGKTGEQISFNDSQTQIDYYLSHGYKLSKFTDDQGKTTTPTSSALTYDKFDDVDGSQNFKLYLVHDIENVTEKGTTTATVKYIVSDGKVQAPSDNVQTINWTRPATKDMVTGETKPTGKWTVNGNGYKDVITPNLEGYTASTASVKAPTPVYGTNPINIVIYSPKIENAQNATLTIYDKTDNNKVMGSYATKGQAGTQIAFQKSDTYVQQLINQGYKLDSFVNDKNETSQTISYDQFDHDDNTTQNFKIYLVHTTEPVDPNHPGHGYSQSDLDKTVTRTINYLDQDGNTIAPSVTKTVEFKGSGIVDKITGQFVKSADDLTPLKDQSKGITWTYTVDGKTSNGNTYEFDATSEKPTIGDFTFNHVDNRAYDGGKGAVKAYDVDATKNPQDLTINVIYAKKPAAITYHGVDNTKTVKRTINYIDSVTGEAIPSNLAPVVTQIGTLHRTQIIDSTGKFVGYGTLNNDGTYTLAKDQNNAWSTDDTSWTQVISPDLTKYGYTAPDQASVAKGIITGTTENNQVITVKYGHTYVPVTPENPKTPTDPVNPDDPNSPKYPKGLTKEDLQKSVKRTIHYVGINSDGTTTAVKGAPDGKSDYTQTVTFTKHAIIDKVTGKLMGYDTNNDGQADTDDSSRAWLPNAGSFDSVNSQTPASVQDKDGKAFDAVDITTVSSTSVLPNSTYQDITVTYRHTPKTPVTTYTAKDDHKTVTRTITYKDSVTRQDIPSNLVKPQTQTVTLHRTIITDNKGKFIGYGTVSKDGKSYTIDPDNPEGWNTGEWAEVDSPDLSSHGYTAPDKASIAKVTVNGSTINDTQVVYYGHQTVPVTPTDPKKPTDPVNPNDPTGPKYPKGVDEQSLNKTVTRTINYVDDQGNKVNGSPDGKSQEVQTIHFTRTAIVDKVTGQILGYDTNGDGHEDTTEGDRAWNPASDTFGEVQSKAPSEVGYTNVDKPVVSSETTTPSGKNITVTVTYGNKLHTYTTGKTEKASVTRTINYFDGQTGEKIPDRLIHDNPVTQTVNFERTQVLEDGKVIGYGSLSADGHSFTAQDWHTTNGQATEWASQVSPDLTNYGYKAPRFEDKTSAAVVGEQGVTATTKNVTVNVYYDHDTVPVTPTNPGKPDQPVNPNDPTGPKYPSGTSATDLQKTVTRTIHYEGADQYTPNDVKQNVNFTAHGVLDKVTGQWVTPLTWSDDQTVAAVNSQIIPGYHIKSVDKDSTDGKNVNASTIKHADSDYTVTVVYEKDPAPTAETTTGKVVYHDDTTNKDIRSDNLSGEVGKNITYTSQDKIKNFVNEGYKLVSSDYTDGTETFAKDASKNNFIIHLVHDTIPVTPSDPGEPNKPINSNDPRDPKDQPKYPSGTAQEDLQKTITRTIHYEGAGEYTPEDVTQNVNFTASGELDKVTGQWSKKLTWSADQEFGAKNSPKIPGYHVVSVDKDANGTDVGSAKIGHDGSNYTVTVKYAPDAKAEQGSLVVTFHDDTDSVDIPGVGTNTGNVDEGTKVTYTSDTDLQNLEDRGYVYVSTDGKIPTEITKGATTVTIHVKHATRPVTPDNPVDPDHPVDPNHPDNPSNKNPQPGLGKTDLQKTITRHVTYIFTDGTQPDAHGLANVTQTVNYHGEGTIDLVTGNLVDVDKDGNITGKGSIKWTSDNNKMDAVSGHAVAGYQISGTTNAKSDGSVDGLTVGPNDTVQDATIIYTPVAKPAPTDQNAHLTIIDRNDASNPITMNTYNGNGKENTAISFSGSDAYVQDLINRGYVIDGFKVGNGSETKPSSFSDINFGNFDTDTKTDQSFTLYLVHGHTTVTPNKPGHPGDPIDPKNPDGPKYPSGTDENSVKRVGTQTIHYVGAGENTPADKTQNVTFTRTITFDNVTGKITEDSGWSEKSHTFGKENTPVVNGYHANVATAGGTTVTPDDLNKTVTVTYSQNGKIVPVDPDGNHIPGTDTPTFPTDPHDPTKVVTGKIPNVPTGWTPVDPGNKPGSNITPDPKDPGKDVKVPFNRPVNPATVTGNITYIDDVTGKTVRYDSFGGKVGDQIDYTTADKINDFKNSGYLIKSNDFNDGQETYKETGNTFTVHLGHQTTIHILQKKITRTVNYVFDDDSSVVPPYTYSVTFNGGTTTDLVTGRVTTTWDHDSQTLEKVIDPTVLSAMNDGYKIVAVDNSNNKNTINRKDGSVAALVVTPEDANSTVTIHLNKAVNGKITYIDDTTHTNLDGAKFGGEVGTKINYTTADRIAFWESKGYGLVSNNFKDGQETLVSEDSSPLANIFEVHLKHLTTPVTPEKPGKPGEPVDPNNPDGPKYPSNYVPQTLTKTITRDVSYVDQNGNSIEGLAPIHQSVSFNGNGVLDLVTGRYVTVDDAGNVTGDGKIVWTPENGSFDNVASPENSTYQVIGIRANTDAVHGNGSIDGETITPQNLNENIVITLAKKTPDVVPASGSIIYIDDAENGKVIGNGAFSGVVGGKINYTTAETISNFESQGYKLVSNDFHDGNETFTNGANKFEVHFIHDYRPVTPDNPGGGYSKTDLEKTVTRQVNYHFTDGNSMNPVNQSTTFTGTGYVDKITGGLVTVENGKITGNGSITWNKTSDTFDATGTIPNGYHITRISTSGASQDINQTTGVVAKQEVTPKTVDSVVDIYLEKDAPVIENTTGSVTYIDDTTGSQLGYGSFGGQVGQKIDYTTQDKIDRIISAGYKLVGTNPFKDGQQTYVKDVAGNTFVIHFEHDIVPVTPDKPNGGYTKDDLDKTITRTINYIYDDGSKTVQPVVQHVHFIGTGYYDKTTHTLVTPGKDGKYTQGGSIKWTVTSDDNNQASYAEVPAIKDMNGYHISGVRAPENVNVDMQTGSVSGQKVTAADSNSVIDIHLKKTPVAANGSITYIDDTTGQTLESTTFTGSVGDKIPYNQSTNRINYYEGLGYKLVGDNPFHDNEQVFDKDAKNNTFEIHFVHTTVPVTPDNPGAGYTKDDLNKTITRTIKYVYTDGTKSPAPVVQHVHFVGTGTYDNVTHQLVTVDKDGKITQGGQITWKITSDNGDKSSYAEVPGIDLGNHYISRIQESGTNANVDDKTGKVSGEDVTQNNINSTVTITLTKKPDVPVAANGSITYIDDTTGQTLESGTFSGAVGGKIPYNQSTNRINYYEGLGYKLVGNNPFHDNEQVFDKDAQKNIFTIHFVHDTVPVTPDKPGYGYTTDDLKKTVTRVVKYVDQNGNNVKTPSNQSFTFEGHGTIDKVTHQLVNVDSNGKITGKGQITWNADNHNFGSVTGIDGNTYQIIGINSHNTDAHVDQTNGNVASETVTPKSNSSEITVTVTKKETPVIPVAKEGSYQVRYLDDTTNSVISGYGISTGTQKAGTKISYGMNEIGHDLSSLQQKGYAYKSTDGNVWSEIGEGNNVVTIHLVHTYTTVTPEKPGHPGDPVDPSNPNGPKYPNGTDESQVKVTGTQTIHYVGAGDNTPSDNTQTFDFTREITFDNVTGQITKTGSWNVTSHTFGNVDTPVVNGYHANVKTAGGTTVTPDDLNKTVTVTYTQDKTPVTPETVTGTIKYIDDTTGKVLKTDVFSGKVGDKISYNSKGVIDGYINNGYKLVSSNFTDDGENFKKSGNEFEVHLTHTTTPVTPDIPVTPDDNPTNPTTPSSPTNEQPTSPNTVVPHGEDPDVPDTPDTPEDTDEETVTPHATTPNGWTSNVGPHGEHVDAHNNVVAKDGKIIGHVDNNGHIHYSTLPQTGNNSQIDETAAALGAAAAGIGMIGLLGVKKRKNKKD